MEKSEILRPGFLAALKPGGIILMADTKIVPQGMDSGQYPDDATINAQLAGFKTIRLDVLKSAIDLGDPSGRSANVVMLGALSAIKPFNIVNETIWLKALQRVSPSTAVWNANYRVFKAGVEMVVRSLKAKD
jgi:indolepyruvate ferredoxin oxidoreductase alpha subunit